jgi:hypothetical protein|tara:strand:+ start:521 stop:838 length:318 start_codon:yes stop_codon:yes gene_type:complete
MGEKTGHLVKIQYDFNTAGVLEVYMKGTWHRTTSREFRSFDGKRRITEPTMTELGNVVVPMRTYEYNGPVYMFGTNHEVETINEGKIVSSPYWDEARKQTEERGV